MQFCDRERIFELKKKNTKLEGRKRKKTFRVEGTGRKKQLGEDYISIIQASRMAVVLRCPSFLHEHRYHIFVPWFGIDTIGMGFEIRARLAAIRGETAGTRVHRNRDKVKF